MGQNKLFNNINQAYKVIADIMVKNNKLFSRKKSKYEETESQETIESKLKENSIELTERINYLETQIFKSEKFSAHRYNLIDDNLLLNYITKVTTLQEKDIIAEPRYFKIALNYLERNILDKEELQNGANRNEFNQNPENNYVVANLLVVAFKNLELLADKFELSNRTIIDSMKSIESSSRYKKLQSYKRWGEKKFNINQDSS